ncbi:MAG: TrkA C-terminal domain-containing protein [Firmicutes bacterium]|nr:TrkA C-terminal domain-containing protein [Bacillota bacterium]
MNIYVALFLFSLVILLYLVISELFTILFRFTGLPRDKARFQVVSILTGCGFTTRESEIFLSTKHRRQLARITMLFGYVFNITVVSTLINVIFSLKLTEQEHFLSSLLIPLAAIVVIFLFTRVPKIRAWGDLLLEKIANRVAHRDFSNSVMIMDYIGKDMIGVVTLHQVPENYQNKTLAEMDLRKVHHILVMLIEHQGKSAEPAMANTRFEKNDKITVFGDYRAICRVFEAQERFEDEETEE